MRSNDYSPNSMFRVLFKHRNLIYICIKREVLGRYRGSLVGLLWMLINPIIMLTIYTFIFSIIFPSRMINDPTITAVKLPLMIFISMIIFNLFSECINRAPHLILTHKNYVTKLIFPLEILSIIDFGASFFQFSINFIIWAIVYTNSFGISAYSFIYFTLVILPFICIIVGLSWIISSVGVYVRDIGQLIFFITNMLLFLSPIFYNIDTIPFPYRRYLYLNPLATIIEQTKNIFFERSEPNWNSIFILNIASLSLLYFGYIFFQRLRGGFSDVL